MRHGSLAFCTFLASLAVGCSSNPSATQVDAGPTTPASNICLSSDPRIQTFTPGLEGTGKTGTLDIKLAAIDPAPPIKGNNHWTLTVADALGNPLDGLVLGVSPFMPDHQHGTSLIPTITSLGSGRYDVTQLSLAMAGVWQVTVSVQSDGGIDASTKFTFCVDE